MSTPDLFASRANDNNTCGRYTQATLLASLLKYLGVSGDAAEENLINRELDLSIPTQIVTCCETFQESEILNSEESELLFELTHASLNDAVYRCKLDIVNPEKGIFDSDEFRVKIPNTPLIYQGDDGIAYQVWAIFEFNRQYIECAMMNRIAVISEVGSDMLRVSCVGNHVFDLVGLSIADWDSYEPPVCENGILTHLYEKTILKYAGGFAKEIGYFRAYVSMWAKINRMLNNPVTRISINDGDMSDKNAARKGTTIGKPIISIQYISNGNGISHESFTRRTDAWYRRGHYRTLKNGKRVYVKGCVCGPNKESMMMQERIIKEG